MPLERFHLFLRGRYCKEIAKNHCLDDDFFNGGSGRFTFTLKNSLFDIVRPISTNEVLFYSYFNPIRKIHSKQSKTTLKISPGIPSSIKGPRDLVQSQDLGRG
jgi:hypothetical protein